MIARAALAVCSIAITVYQQGLGISQDGTRLQEDVRPKPFHLRWLLPFVLRKRLWAWCAVSWSCLIASTLIFPGNVWAAALWVSLPWFRAMATLPVLVDAPAFLLSLATTLTRRPTSLSQPNYALALAIVGAFVSEKVPVFAAAFTGRVELLIGLVSVVIAAYVIKSRPTEGSGPLKTGRMRAMRWTDASALLLPWGAGLAAILAPWNVQALTVIVVSYAQLFIAWDTSRLYQWAAPVILPKAVSVIPRRYLPLAVAATWFNPWASSKQRGTIVL